MRPVVFTFAAASTTAICSAQTLGAAGALTIDGTLIDTAALSLGVRRAIMGGGFMRPVTLTSAGDISAVNFTIVGTDFYGNTITETIAGPNANTVSTTKLFNMVTSVTTNAAVATGTSVGSGTTGRSNWYLVNREIAPSTMALYCVITGTINYTVQDTADDLASLYSGNGAPTVNTFDHPTLAAKVASANSNYAYPPRFVSALVNSSSGGTLVFSIIPAGIV